MDPSQQGQPGRFGSQGSPPGLSPPIIGGQPPMGQPFMNMPPGMQPGFGMSPGMMPPIGMPPQMGMPYGMPGPMGPMGGMPPAMMPQGDGPRGGINPHMAHPAVVAPVEETPEPDDEPKPEDVWKEMKNSDGRIFWHNASKKKSVWTKPSELQSDQERYLSGHCQWHKYDSGDGSYWSHSVTNESSWKVPKEVEVLLERYEVLEKEMAELPTEKDHSESNPNYAKILDKNKAKGLLKSFFEFKGHGKFYQKPWEEVSKLWIPVTPPDWGHKKVREADRGANNKWYPLDERAFCFAKLTAGERKQCFNEYWNVLNKKIKEDERKAKIVWREQCLSDLQEWNELFPWTTYEELAQELHDRPWWHFLEEKEKQAIFDEVLDTLSVSIRQYLGILRGRSDRRSLPTMDNRKPSTADKEKEGNVANDRPLQYDPFLTHNAVIMMTRMFPDVRNIDWISFRALVEGLQRNSVAQTAIVNYEIELLQHQARSLENGEGSPEDAFDPAHGVGEPPLPTLYDPKSAMDVIVHLDKFGMLRVYQYMVKETVDTLHRRMDRAHDAILALLRQTFVSLIHKQIKTQKITPTSSFRKFLNSRVDEGGGDDDIIDLEQLTGLDVRLTSRKRYFQRIIKILNDHHDTMKRINPTLRHSSEDTADTTTGVAHHWAYLNLLGADGATPREIYDFTTVKIHDGMMAVIDMLQSLLPSLGVSEDNLKDFGLENFEKVLFDKCKDLKRQLQEGGELDKDKEKLARTLDLLLSSTVENRRARKEEFGHTDILEIAFHRMIRSETSRRDNTPSNTHNGDETMESSNRLPSKAICEASEGVPGAATRKNALG